jgi:hypothetical protein
MTDAAELTPTPPEEQKMEIHKPKPFHDWREFLAELFIVVLGVSIALAAEQTVEYIHWRAQVAEARELIASELARNVRQATYRLRTSTCVERRLDELAVILDGAAKTGSLPPLGDIASPVRGYWPSGSWESVVASQTATHFPRQQLAAITLTYRYTVREEEFSRDEIPVWNTLYAMVGPGRRLDPSSEARLREALSQARSTNRLMAIIANQVVVSVHELGLAFSPEDKALIAETRNMSLFAPRSLFNSGEPFGLICAPIGKPPEHYGQGIYGAGARQIDDAVKTLPDFGGGK